MATKTIEVSAGILVKENGEFLLATRPKGDFKDYWEFPGGKIEPGETPKDAAIRELEEELGVTVTDARFWKTTEHAYLDRFVRLHVFICFAWNGAPEAKEGQRFQWMTNAEVSPLLPSATPLIDDLPEAIKSMRLIEGTSKINDN